MKEFRELIAKMRLCPLRTVGIVVGFAASALFFYFFVGMIWGDPEYWASSLGMGLIFGNVIGVFYVGPLILSIYNLVYLIFPHSSAQMAVRARRMEVLTIGFGAICAFLWCNIREQIKWDKNWWEQLYNSELHAPIATWTLPTIITLAVVGLLGYGILYAARIHPLPPLLKVLGMGGLYVGAVLCLVTFVHLCSQDIILCVYLGNLLVIFLRVMKELVLQEPDSDASRLPGLQRFLSKGRNLPWLGLLATVPVLGVVLAVLTLFGQAPDSIIQAWTQTSDWTLSQQVAPPNLTMDMHYLCTVAAGGHRKLVKPLRMGKRHGHAVLVNRQLAVANAFEELLQQRLPRFHRVVRQCYDRYGYPIAKHIRSPWAADAVWLLMKPAEWFFLGCLYLFDNKPENRIAVQYPHAPLPKSK